MSNITDIQTTYSDSDILGYKNLAAVRNRPSGYLNDLENAGITHVLKEIIDNALDEIALMGSAGLALVLLCRDTARNCFQVVVRDNGRAIPLDSLVRVVTELNTSGKYNTKVYKNSTGTFGVGGKVAAGTAKFYRVITARLNQGLASITVKQADHPESATMTDATPPRQGVTVITEPDDHIFKGVDTYGETGYLMLVELLQKYCVFHPHNIKMLLSDEPLDSAFWDFDPNAAMAYIDQRLADGREIFSPGSFNPRQFLHTYWRLSRPFAWEYEFVKPDPSDVGLQQWAVRLYVVKFEQSGGRFGMVNNVPIDSVQSNHFTVLMDELKHALARQIERREVRQFFTDSYRLPIFVAVDIKYEGAEFVGMTKHAFVDSVFREVYRSDIRDHLHQNPSMIADLYVQLKDDIEARYNAAMKNAAPKSMGLLFLELKRPHCFQNCEAKGDRTGTELFLTEGASAANIEGHDSMVQAIYAMRGKTINITKERGDGHQLKQMLLRDPVYHDIFTILGYDPMRANLNTLRFERCNIMVDADYHGRHISSIVVGNFTAVAPELVDRGFLSIITPPYYELKYGSKKNPAKMFLRTKRDVELWKILNVYRRAIDIEIKTAGGDVRALNKVEYIDFCLKLLRAGEALTRLADEFALPPLMLEALTLVSEYLAVGKVDTQKIADILRADRVGYIAETHVLTLSLGDNDWIIPLMGISDRLYTEVMAFLRTTFAWRQLEIYITSPTGLLKRERYSPLHLYLQLLKFDEAFDVRIFKGLGGMQIADVVTTCMDRRYRSALEITDIGDIDIIVDMLGADPGKRKLLLERPIGAGL